MTNEELRDIEFCKTMLLTEIQKINADYEALRDKLSQEVVVSVIYLKTFSTYIKDKKFGTIEEAWQFVNDMKGIVEKISYVCIIVLVFLQILISSN